MNINYDFFKKKNMKGFMLNQFLPATLIIVVGMYLVKGKVSPLYTFFSIIFLYYYSYFIHIFFHNLPDSLNPHFIHHNNKELPRLINLLIETLTDILFFVILYGFQKLINYEIFPSILILYYGIIYISVHIINFSLFGVESHKKHHTKKN